MIGGSVNKNEKRQRTLQMEVERLAARTVPMHMPGHKRMLRPSDALPYDWDITEIEGADDLHDAHGILAEAMERAADLWGARRTWFLVGGSTCGILAAIRAAAPFGSEIIAARNCHRSVFHAIELGSNINIPDIRGSYLGYQGNIGYLHGSRDPAYCRRSARRSSWTVRG